MELLLLMEEKKMITTTEKAECSDSLPAGANRWQTTSCRKCKSRDGYWVENSRGDAEYTCCVCNHSWWVDGPDY